MCLYGFDLKWASYNRSVRMLYDACTGLSNFSCVVCIMSFILNSWSVFHLIKKGIRLWVKGILVSHFFPHSSFQTRCCTFLINVVHFPIVIKFLYFSVLNFIINGLFVKKKSTIWNTPFSFMKCTICSFSLHIPWPRKYFNFYYSKKKKNESWHFFFKYATCSCSFHCTHPPENISTFTFHLHF